MDEIGSETGIPSCFSGKIEEEADPVETGSGVATTSGEAAPAEELSEDISIKSAFSRILEKRNRFPHSKENRDLTIVLTYYLTDKSKGKV